MCARACVWGGVQVMLVSRVVLGDPHYQIKHQSLRRPPERGGAFATGASLSQYLRSGCLHSTRIGHLETMHG